MMLEKISQEKFQKDHKDKLWEISAVYDLDCKNIKDCLHDEAEKAISPTVGLSGINIERVKAEAYHHYASCGEDLKSLYNLGSMPVRGRLIEDAKKGVLKQKSPETSTITTWLFAAILGLLLEIFIIGFLIVQGASMSLFIIGGVLVICLIVGGLGLSNLLIQLHHNEYLGSEKDSGRKPPWPWRATILPVIGILGLIVVSIIRIASSHSYLTGIIILLLGVMTIVAKGLHGSNKKSRHDYLTAMFHAQQFYAAMQLKDDLKDPDDWSDDKWYVVYQANIDLIAKRIVDSTSRNPSSAANYKVSAAGSTV